MRIGGVDVAVTHDNIKRLQRSSDHKRARIETAQIETVDELIASCENESSSQSSSEFEQSSEIEEECPGPSHLVSFDVCKLTDKTFVSLRSTSGILNQAANSLGKPAKQRSQMTVYRRKRKFRKEAVIKGEEKMMQTVYQVAFDGKKLLVKERLAVLAISTEGDYFLGIKTFQSDERCNAEACSRFIIRYDLQVLKKKLKLYLCLCVITVKVLIFLYIPRTIFILRCVLAQ